MAVSVCVSSATADNEKCTFRIPQIRNNLQSERRRRVKGLFMSERAGDAQMVLLEEHCNIIRFFQDASTGITTSFCSHSRPPRPQSHPPCRPVAFTSILLFCPLPLPPRSHFFPSLTAFIFLTSALFVEFEVYGLEEPHPPHEFASS
jgi:hypothetical protein